MRRKNPQTVRGWAAKYRRMHAEYIKTFNDLKRQSFVYKERLMEARAEIAALKASRDRSNARDWTAFDKASDAVTREEQSLFEQSPAYIRYQQLRTAREEGRPFTDAERARRLLVTGNWRAP